MARYAKVDNGTVSDIFDGPPLEDLQATYPDSIFQEADHSIQRGWTWDGTQFINPSPPPTIQPPPIPTDAEIELLIRAERDRLESLATATWGPEQKEILFTRISAEIDGRKNLMAEVPIMRGIAKAMLKKDDPTNAEIEEAAKVVIAQVEGLAKYAQQLTMAYRALVAQIPTLTDEERRSYDAETRFEEAMNGA